MKIDDIRPLHLLTGAIISAESTIAASEKEQRPGYGNMPTVGMGYDQTGAHDIKEVAAARLKLAKNITKALREYRKDLVKALKKYGISEEDKK